MATPRARPPLPTTTARQSYRVRLTPSPIQPLLSQRPKELRSVRPFLADEEAPCSSNRPPTATAIVSSLSLRPGRCSPTSRSQSTRTCPGADMGPARQRSTLHSGLPFVDRSTEAQPGPCPMQSNPRASMSAVAVTPKRGGVNLDAVELPGVDTVTDLELCRENPLPFEDDRFDEFLLSHVIEHVQNTLPLMQELHRIATPRGPGRHPLPLRVERRCIRGSDARPPVLPQQLWVLLAALLLARGLRLSRRLEGQQD